MNFILDNVKVGFLFFYINAANGELKILLDGRDLRLIGAKEHISIVEGDPLLLRCVSNYTNSTFAWRIGLDGLLSLNDTLELKKIRLEDEGKFYCRATSFDEMMKTYVTENQDVYVKVLVPPSSPIIEHPSSCLPGEDITFVCHSDGIPAPTFEWRQVKVDGRILSRNQTYHTTCISNFYITCNVQSLLITTLAEPRREFQTLRILQYVHIPAFIKAFPSNMNSVKTGDNVTVMCNFGGYPASKTWWTKCDDSNFYALGNRLVENNVQTSFSGIYICHAENTIVAANKTEIYIHVTDQVKIIVLGNDTSDSICSSCDTACHTNTDAGEETGSYKGTVNEGLLYFAVVVGIIALIIGVISSYFCCKQRRASCLGDGNLEPSSAIRENNPSKQNETSLALGDYTDLHFDNVH